MLRLANVTLSRGTKRLLEGAGLTVHPGHRVGLVGANGSGKSSLFALLRGELDADAGEVVLPGSWVIAHVAQETPAVSSAAIEYVVDGHSARARAATLLSGLGFVEARHSDLVANFSGGWRMRLNLAQALMMRSD